MHSGSGQCHRNCDFLRIRPCPLGPVTANTDKVLGSKTRASKGMMCQRRFNVMTGVKTYKK